MTKILKFKELRAYGVLYSRTHVDRLERMGKFPKRVPLGSFRMGWLESEIISYVRTQIAGRSRDLGSLGSAGKIKKIKGRKKKTRAPETVTEEESPRPIIPVPLGSHEPC